MARRKRNPQNDAGSAAAEAAALERFRPLLSAEELASLEAELQRPLHPAIRLNPLKVAPAAALAELAVRYGWETRPVPYCANGWWVTAAQTPVGQTLEHRLGYYYVQDAASMLPVELFDFEAGSAPLILDMAASPGGKTTHLVANSGDRGLVVANDSSQGRITALRLVLQNWSAIHAVVTRFPGERLGAWFPETFDRVLLDAPCSMQSLRSTEAHPMRPITEREQASLALRQARLLESALQAVKVGGQVVYSTCTLAPEEDEAVLDAVLKRLAGAARIENVRSRLPKAAPGLTDDGRQRFDPAVQQAVRLWPHRYGTSGFFAARLTKQAPLELARQSPPGRPWAQTGLSPLSTAQVAGLAASWLDWYGFDLRLLMEQQGFSLWEKGETLYAIPVAYLRHFAELPFQSIGLALGEEIPAGVVPSHEWVTRFSGHFRDGRYRLPAEFLAAWNRGEDIRPAPAAAYPAGTVVVVEDEAGHLLGRGKILADRLRNLLPRRLVFS